MPTMIFDGLKDDFKGVLKIGDALELLDLNKVIHYIHTSVDECSGQLKSLNIDKDLV